MSDDSRDELIPGIYNYCDRWCERCPLSARCMVYALHSGRLTESQIAPRVGDGHDGVSGFVNEEPVVSESEAAQQLEAVQAQRRQTHADTLCVQAEGYAQLVHEWLQGGGPPEPRTSSDVAPEPLEVIAHLHFHIAAKVYRAVAGTLDDEYEPHEVQNDENGSAKVALLAIRRSELAWMEVRPPDAARARAAVALLDILGELREALEARFPRAHDFVRPGFDQVTDAGGRQL